MVGNKFGLGKGLGALLPSDETQGLIELPINSIGYSPYQPRSGMDESALQELADSIKKSGIIQPIVVRRTKTGSFELIAGERRLRASKIAGFEQIPAVIREISDNDAAEFALVENIQREDLNPIDIARAMKRLHDEFGYTQDKIADGVKKSRPYVANLLRLLDLPDEAQNNILDGKITEGHGRALLSLKDDNLILQMINRVISNCMSVRQTERMVKDIHKNFPSKKFVKMDSKSQDTELAEKILRETLGTKVRVGSSKIEIDYFGKDDLERICEVIAG